MSSKKPFGPTSSINEAAYDPSNFADAAENVRLATGKEWPSEGRPQLRRSNLPMATWKNSPLAAAGSFNLAASSERNVAWVDDGEKTPSASETFPSGHGCSKKQAGHKCQFILLALLSALVIYLGVSHHLCMQKLRGLEQEMFLWPRDFVGRQDFASRYNGGDVVASMTTKATSKSNPTNNPIVALDDDLRVGHCWKIEGSAGQLTIAMSQAVKITNITIDHVPRELVSSVRSAPRSVLVWGSLGGNENEKGMTTVGTENNLFGNTELQTILRTRRFPPIHSSHTFYVPLAIAEYDIHSQHHIQTFPVFATIATLNTTFTTVVVEILSNWGATSTCLYRVRVHGKPSSDIQDT